MSNVAEQHPNGLAHASSKMSDRAIGYPQWSRIHPYPMLTFTPALSSARTGARPEPTLLGDVKPGGAPFLRGCMRRPARHPACRLREAQPSSCTERENLYCDVKGKAQAAPTARPKVPMRRLGADCSRAGHRPAPHCITNVRPCATARQFLDCRGPIILWIRTVYHQLRRWHDWRSATIVHWYRRSSRPRRRNLLLIHRLAHIRPSRNLYGNILEFQHRNCSLCKDHRHISR